MAGWRGAARRTGSTIDAVRQWHSQAQLEAEQKAQAARDAARPIDGATLRRFSPIGPCIEMGEVLRHTAKTVTVQRTMNRCVKRYGGYDWTGNGETPIGQNLLHTVPCPSCMDHPRNIPTVTRTERD